MAVLPGASSSQTKSVTKSVGCTRRRPTSPGSSTTLPRERRVVITRRGEPAARLVAIPARVAGPSGSTAAGSSFQRTSTPRSKLRTSRPSNPEGATAHRHPRLPLVAGRAGAARPAPRADRGSRQRPAALRCEFVGDRHQGPPRAARASRPSEPLRLRPRIRAIGIEPLAIEHAHALAVADLPTLHRDPFDRMLVAQARHLWLRIVTADADIARYDVSTILV